MNLSLIRVCFSPIWVKIITFVIERNLIEINDNGDMTLSNFRFIYKLKMSILAIATHSSLSCNLNTTSLEL